MDKQDLTLTGLLVDSSTSEAHGFVIPNWCFDRHVQNMVRSNLQHVKNAIPLEESVQIVICANEEDIQAILMYDTLVKGLVTTAGGQPLVWDEKTQVFRVLDGARYSGRYGGLVREQSKLDRAESLTIASFLSRCNIKYPAQIPDHTRERVDGILHSFIQQYPPN